MSSLDTSQRVIGLARSLGLKGHDGPVSQIVGFCVARILELIDGCNVRSLNDLERVVCRKLNLAIEEIHAGEDIEQLINKYVVIERDVAFASIRTHFDGDIFGSTFVRRKHESDEPSRYVAFIDCRGSKGFRRYFTRWHEIAHLLTLPPRPGHPVFREEIKSSPLEQMMDIIAGSIGFFEPIFGKAVDDIIRRRGHLGFQEVEELRLYHCPSASFQATLIAAVPRASTPAIYLEAAMAYKKQELAKLNSRQPSLFDRDQPEAKLRLTRVTGNEAARRDRFRFDRNMQVPEDSLIYRTFSDGQEEILLLPNRAIENQSSWRHSDGSTLGTSDVIFEARRLTDRVFALARPI